MIRKSAMANATPKNTLAEVVTRGLDSVFFARVLGFVDSVDSAPESTFGARVLVRVDFGAGFVAVFLDSIDFADFAPLFTFADLAESIALVLFLDSGVCDCCMLACAP